MEHMARPRVYHGERAVHVVMEWLEVRGWSPYGSGSPLVSALFGPALA
jgi:hypothetical protein